jgi:hypothetical protein
MSNKAAKIPKDYQYEWAGVYYKIRWLTGKDIVFRYSNGDWVRSSIAPHEIRRNAVMRRAIPAVELEAIDQLVEEQLSLTLGPEPEPEPEPEPKPKRVITPPIHNRKPEAPRLPNGSFVMVVTDDLEDQEIGIIKGADRFTEPPMNYFIKSTHGGSRWVASNRVAALRVDPDINPVTGERHAPSS